jgi:hypothetical protein
MFNVTDDKLDTTHYDTFVIRFSFSNTAFVVVKSMLEVF